MKRFVLFSLIFTVSAFSIFAQSEPAKKSAKEITQQKFPLPHIENPYKTDCYKADGQASDDLEYSPQSFIAEAESERTVLKQESDYDVITGLLQFIMLPALIYYDYKNPEQAAIRESNAPVDKLRRKYDALSY